MQKMDDTNPIKVADDIWWVGFADYEAGFSNNPYLLVDEEEAILFDPGPGHPMFRDLILQKIEQVTSPEKVRYIVVHHQDPDLCGLIPIIENLLHPDLVIITHPRTSVFIPYYGSRKGILPVGDGDTLKLKSGRRIAFYHAPYLHFAGNIMSYDEKTASLFSSDIFAVFDREWRLYADESYIGLARNFIEHYVASKEPVLYAYEKIKNLKINRILPQHGGIIKDNIESFVHMLTETEPGQLIKELKNKPSPEQAEELLQTGRDWLEQWSKKKVEAESLDELMKAAMGEGPSAVSLIMDAMTEKARKMGVSNPMISTSQEHEWDNIWSVQTTQMMDSVRRRFLSRQYGVRYGIDSKIAEMVERGLKAFKTNVAIMFVDIRGFTKWSSEKPPDEVVEMLNKEYEVVSRIIHSGGGRVNKLMGDGILAYFPEHKAVDCPAVGLRIQQAVAAAGLLPVGVGCDFGEVIMGDMGQEIRLDYTLIGSVVNYASRMCDSAREGEVALSKRLFEKLSEQKRQELTDSHSAKTITVQVKPTDPELEGILLK